MDPNTGSVGPEGEYLQPDAETVARREAVGANLVRVGFISSATAERLNPAVDVLAALLPRDCEIGVCLSCHEFKASGAYAFGETTGLFWRPPTALSVGPYASVLRGSPPPRAEIVGSTSHALFWTLSRARMRGTRVIGDDVTLYSVPFAEILGATVRDRRKGILDVWIDAGRTLSFKMAASEVDFLYSCIDAAAAEG